MKELYKTIYGEDLKQKGIPEIKTIYIQKKISIVVWKIRVEEISQKVEIKDEMKNGVKIKVSSNRRQIEIPERNN